jgi:MFS family permease
VADDGERGTLRPTPPGLVLGWALAGLVGGWFLHPLTDRWGNPPLVTWPQPLALALVAAILGFTAWSTWRTVHVHREPLDPHRAVNRLVLARACALVGALAGGGYLGYGLSWIGDSSELAEQRIWRCGAATVAGVLVVVASLLLERACRVHGDPDEPGRP